MNDCHKFEVMSNDLCEMLEMRGGFTSINKQIMYSVICSTMYILLETISNRSSIKLGL